MMGSNDTTDTTGQPAEHNHRDDRDGLDAAADLMPWLATLLIHGAAVLIAILFVWITLDQPKPDDADVPPTITFNPQREKIELTKFDSVFKDKPKGRPSPNANQKSDPIDSAITPTLNDTIGVRGSNADVGELFKQSGGGEDGLFGPGPAQGGAKTIVFVIDASGSMIDTLPFVAAELKRTVRSLNHEQSFTVLFYQNDTVIEAVSPGLKNATDENKLRLYDWIDSDTLAPMGLSNPIKAIEQGLRYKPQLMFLLSDNITGHRRYNLNQRDLLASVQRANTGRTKINTIQFLYPDPLSRIAGMKPTLQMISEQTQGIYRFFSAKELGL